MLSATNPYIIRNVFIDSSRAFITRARDDITDEEFDVSNAYSTSLWSMDFSAKASPRRAFAEGSSKVGRGDGFPVLDVRRSRVATGGGVSESPSRSSHLLPNNRCSLLTKRLGCDEFEQLKAHLMIPLRLEYRLGTNASP